MKFWSKNIHRAHAHAPDTTNPASQILRGQGSMNRLSTARIKRRGAWILAVVASCLIVQTTARAQIDTVMQNEDQLLALARQKAFAGQFQEARKICASILAHTPTNDDARVLLGRTFAWDGQWEEARVELNRVLVVRPDHHDALSALADVELWDHKYERALEIVNSVIKSNPNDEEFLLKKIKALKALGRDEEALVDLIRLEDINPSITEIPILRKSFANASLNNGVGLNYASDHFSETYDPMHYAYIQFSRRTVFGSIFARLNYSGRFGSHGTQIEADLYPRLAEGVYAYLNYGISSSDLFPRHRAGAELYTKLLPNSEGSFGIRYLNFGSSPSVTIYTASLGLYSGNYWISFRPYFIPNQAAVSTSANLTIRRYLGDSENFFSLRAGAGFSADERAIQSNAGFLGQEVFYLKSQTVGAGWQGSVMKDYLLVTTFDVTNQELGANPGSYVTMYSLSVGVRVRF